MMIAGSAKPKLSTNIEGGKGSGPSNDIEALITFARMTTDPNTGALFTQKPGSKFLTPKEDGAIDTEHYRAHLSNPRNQLIINKLRALSNQLEDYLATLSTKKTKQNGAVHLQICTLELRKIMGDYISLTSEDASYNIKSICRFMHNTQSTDKQFFVYESSMLRPLREASMYGLDGTDCITHPFCKHRLKTFAAQVDILSKEVQDALNISPVSAARLYGTATPIKSIIITNPLTATCSPTAAIG